MLTLVLYVVVPKGFFPVQDTGVLLAITQADQSVSFDAMSVRQQNLARKILEDPDVESVSSFIGIDAQNETLNSGEIQINLKDKEKRSKSAQEIIQRLQPNVNKVDGIETFLQPLQDLTVEDRVSRTQYQYSVEDARFRGVGDGYRQAGGPSSRKPARADRRCQRSTIEWPTG